MNIYFLSFRSLETALLSNIQRGTDSQIAFSVTVHPANISPLAFCLGQTNLHKEDLSRGGRALATSYPGLLY